MKFKSVADMQRDVTQNLHRVPPCDVVVGVPRSGMLAASLLALNLNLPLAELDGFCRGEVFESGKTRGQAGMSDLRRVLVLDDSSRTGAAIRDARAKIERANVALDEVTYAVVYGTSSARSVADLIFEVVDGPRIFEWNVLHHPGVLANAMLDIDGVLCHDPTVLENDDGPGYERFLESARPMHLPSHPVQALVTSRLEKYRPQTEAWLAAHKVTFGSLIMLDQPDAAARRASGNHGRHKAQHYGASQATLFVESELWQAEEIARLSGKPVLSLEGPDMIVPNALGRRAVVQALSNKRVFAKRIRQTLGDDAADRLKSLYLKARRP